MSATAKSQTQSIIELHWENHGGVVRVVPPDQDKMILPVEDAIQACRAYEDQIAFKNQFDRLLQHLGTWIQKHRDVLDRACLTTRDAGMLFLVVRKDRVYDTQFESELTELDWKIANDSDFHLIRLEVLALPYASDEAVRSFLAARNIIEYRFHG